MKRFFLWVWCVIVGHRWRISARDFHKHIAGQRLEKPNPLAGCIADCRRCSAHVDYLKGPTRGA